MQHVGERRAFIAQHDQHLQQLLHRLLGREAPFLVWVSRIEVEPQGAEVAIHQGQQHTGILLGGHGRTTSTRPWRAAALITCQQEPARRAASALPLTIRSTGSFSGLSGSKWRYQLATFACPARWGVRSTTSRSRSESGRAVVQSAIVTVVMLPVSPPHSGQPWPPAAWPGHSAQPHQFLMELLRLLHEGLNAAVFPRRHALLVDGIEAPALGFDRIECGRRAQTVDGHGHRFAAVWAQSVLRGIRSGWQRWESGRTAVMRNATGVEELPGFELVVLRRHCC